MSWQKSWSATIWPTGTAAESCGWGCWADLPDRDSPMGAEGRSWVREARKEVDRLNRKYGGGFYLFSGNPVTVPGMGAGWAGNGSGARWWSWCGC